MEDQSIVICEALATEVTSMPSGIMGCLAMSIQELYGQEFVVTLITAVPVFWVLLQVIQIGSPAGFNTMSHRTLVSLRLQV